MDQPTDRSLQLMNLLQSRSLTICAAESCTGGLISTLLTAHPGASAVFMGSICSYSLWSKTNLLGISPESLAKDGVVSQGTAIAMASSARRLFSCDFALSTTGETGPTPSDSKQPLGTVWCCISSRTLNHSFCLQLSGTRTTIRAQASFKMIDATHTMLTQEK